MVLIRPRLTEFHNIFIPQAELPFAIPFLNEDIPLYVDPFLLWKSPSQQDKALHLAMINSFNHFGYLAKKGREEEALAQLVLASECDEVGLGVSSNRKGRRIDRSQAEAILNLFRTIPEYEHSGFRHFEEIQFYVHGISKDRISDFACNFLKSFLIDFTIDACNKVGLPLSECKIPHYFNPDKLAFEMDVACMLPSHPLTNAPLLLVPTRWLRFGPWIDFEDYFKSYCPRDDIFNPGEEQTRVQVLNYNRDHYGVVESYIREKERTAQDCKTDPLFSALPVHSAKRKLAEILKLPSGKTGNADKKYEDAVSQLMATLMYPHLDFASTQVRTESGAQIRDLIFYNNQSHPFLDELFTEYESRQLVMELKNTKGIDREHINQLNRYMTNQFGRFGVLVTRNELASPRLQNTIDLWSGQRRCIVTLTDDDITQMVDLFESRQRLPLDVLKKKYLEFRRACPA